MASFKQVKNGHSETEHDGIDDTITVKTVVGRECVINSEKNTGLDIDNFFELI
jgi:hypothetical protein